MNAPLQQRKVPAPGPFDARPELREDIFEHMGGCAVYAGLAQTFAERGDDAGLRYAITCAIAHLNAAKGSFNDIVALNKKSEGHDDAP